MLAEGDIGKLTFQVRDICYLSVCDSIEDRAFTKSGGFSALDMRDGFLRKIVMVFLLAIDYSKGKLQH